jgi:hypothetical protein
MWLLQYLKTALKLLNRGVVQEKQDRYQNVAFTIVIGMLFMSYTLKNRVIKAI